MSNAPGDFDYVFEKTARLWLMQRQPLSDFQVIGGHFFPFKCEQFLFKMYNCSSYLGMVELRLIAKILKIMGLFMY